MIRVGYDHWHLSPKPQLISWKHHRHIYFFDLFMHFELRRYTDGASNLLIEVWDSSASGYDVTYDHLQVYPLYFLLIFKRHFGKK